MLFFLYGPDTYRSQKKLNEIINYYQQIHKNRLNLKYFDFKENNYEDFKSKFFTTSLFSGKKLFILKNCFLNEDFKKQFVKNFSIFSKSKNIILFYEKEINTKDPFFSFLKEKVEKSQEFVFLNNEKLKNWIKKITKEIGGEITENAINKLIEFVGNNSQRIVEEIKKLVVFKNKKIIEEKDIEILVKPEIETNIFKIIDALAKKDKKIALKLIHQYLKKKGEINYLFLMIVSQFRNLLIIKSLLQNYSSYWTISKISGINPFVVKKTLIQEKNFKLEELKKIYQQLSELDFNIKKGEITPQIALDLIITKI